MPEDVPTTPVSPAVFTPSATHPRIILLVVGTIAVLSVIYVVTMAICVLMGTTPQPIVAAGFSHAGDVLLGALIGLLINTRTPPPGDPLAPKAQPQSAELPTQSAP